MDPLEQERSITDLEKKIDRLRALYDMYFMGIEKLEPVVPKKEVERHVAILRKEGIRNTAQRFRFQQQVQRYSTLLSYWGRIARQIEEGTYRRDVMRAKARVEGEPDAGLPPDERGGDRAGPVQEVDLSDFDEDAEKTDPSIGLAGVGTPGPPRPPPPSAPAPPAPGRAGQPSMAELLAERRAAAPAVPPPRPAQGAAGLTEQRMQDIYRHFVAARQRCNEPVRGLSFEKVREQLRQREASLVQKHGKAVDFEVTIKDGKAVLRAVPRGS